MTPDEALHERVARAIDPVAWRWIDKVRAEDPDHIAPPWTLKNQLGQAERAVTAAQTTLCPFRLGGPAHDLEPNDPYPVCGDLGDDIGAVSRCIQPFD